jgi:hypothetical protein
LSVFLIHLRRTNSLLALLLPLLVIAFGLSHSADAFTPFRAEFETLKPQNPNPMVSQDETALKLGERLVTLPHAYHSSR